MATHRKLRIATALCTAVLAGAGPAGWAAAASPAQPAVAPAAAAHAAVGLADLAPSPSPDPFRDLTADQIADRAVAATQSATSLRMTGRVVTDGQPLDVDFAVNDHSECTGKLRIGGGGAELRQVEGVTYMKGDEKFWRTSMTSQGLPEPQIDATIELLEGRWLKITPGQAGSGDLGGVCDLKAMLADLDKDEADRRGMTRGPDAEVAGTPVATLVKKKPTGETTTVSVSQVGKPHILKIVKTGGEEPGTMVLSAYDKPVKVVVPPEDETVDLSKLDPGSSV
ncbi:hypothetical protein [Streptomyces sp. NPDC058745]|uniref:hypothetical protein n=1 Tax=Streptomyces sp. NPDC058745 TaxID=3346621 RepID=UPI0036B84A09